MCGFVMFLKCSRFSQMKRIILFTLGKLFPVYLDITSLSLYLLNKHFENKNYLS